MKDDSIYLKHILDSIRRIEEDTTEGREMFLASHTLQDAVLRNLQTLSESAKRLSDPSSPAIRKSNGGGSPPSEIFSFTIILESIWNGFGKLSSKTFLN